MNDTPPAPSAPAAIPDFELIREIGRGGFGQVWLARNRTTGRLRAIKVIARSRVGRSDPAGREVVSITRLEKNVRCEHPGLLTIHHVGQTDEHVFFVMDLADDLAGEIPPQPSSYRPASLAERLADGPLPSDECLACTEQLLAGLAFLHAAGMVHRDVKPANCLFVDGRLKLADFGLLTFAGAEVSRIGTEGYMPPDGRMDTRADVYAAGLVIYEMLTGFAADRFPQLGARAEAVAADPILAALIPLVLKACQPDPGDRFRDAAEMHAALENRAADGNACESRSRRALLIAGAALVAGAAGVGYWWTRPAAVDVNFITYPFEAFVLIDGQCQTAADGTPRTTPCTIEDLPASTHQVTFRHPDHADLSLGRVDFATTGQVVGRFKDREAR